MKKLISLFPAIFFILFCAAQNDFKTYEQPIPGSPFRFKMIPIKEGDFLMGSPLSEKGREPDEDVQQKTHVAGFWICTFEVTRDEFDIFLRDENTSQNSDVDAITRPSPQYIDFSEGMGKTGGFPANSMSQYSALMYCRWLYQKTGVFYRLPTEAEWEYACRAGSSSMYYFGNDSSRLDKYAWYDKNSDDKFHKAGEKLPNAWDLYDMLGNVMEWTLDHYETPRSTAMNTVPNKARYPKALKGGGFAETASDLRSANRFKSDPSWNRRDPQIPKSKWWLTDARSVGFRIVRPQKQLSPEEINEFFKKYLNV